MRSSLKLLSAVTVLALVGSSPLLGQATRTWVSGVGDDANPCSRTAPCKTFAGAISKTATGGEINVLDPGGFGGVTITKAITISSEGFEAGILVSGTNAVIINAGSTSVVTLRGLDFEGLGTGINGVRFLAGAALHIENSRIAHFSSSGHGVSMEPSSGTSELYITDSIILENLGANSSGVSIRPTGAASVNAYLERVQLSNNSFGIKADGSATSGAIRVSMYDSSVVGSTFAGITAISSPGAGVVDMMLDQVVAGNNAGSGILSSGSPAVIRMGQCSVSGNNTGLNPQSSGQIISFGDNYVGGNVGSNGAPSSTTPRI